MCWMLVIDELVQSQSDKNEISEHQTIFIVYSMDSKRVQMAPTTQANLRNIFPRCNEDTHRHLRYLVPYDQSDVGGIVLVTIL